MEPEPVPPSWFQTGWVPVDLQVEAETQLGVSLVETYWLVGYCLLFEGNVSLLLGMTISSFCSIQDRYIHMIRVDFLGWTTFTMLKCWLLPVYCLFCPRNWSISISIATTVQPVSPAGCRGSWDFVPSLSKWWRVSSNRITWDYRIMSHNDHVLVCQVVYKPEDLVVGEAHQQVHC